MMLKQTWFQIYTYQERIHFCIFIFEYIVIWESKWKHMCLKTYDMQDLNLDVIENHNKALNVMHW